MGAFTVFAGSGAHVGAELDFAGGGAGGASNAKREALSRAGDETACARVAANDSRPPAGCSAPIRVHLVAIEDVTCAKGKRWDGAKCGDEGAGLLLLLLGLAAL